MDYYRSNNIYLEVPIYDKKNVNYETKDINNLISAKSCDFLSNNNNLINSYNKNSSHIYKLNENSKIIANNFKNTLIKRNGQIGEKIIHNYNESDVQKLSNNTISKKMGLIKIPIKQTKLALLEPFNTL